MSRVDMIVDGDTVAMATYQDPDDVVIEIEGSNTIQLTDWQKVNVHVVSGTLQ